MRYIKVDNDKFIEYNEDNNSTRVIIKSEVEGQLSQVNDRLKEVGEITDEVLLEWARENYPNIPKVVEKTNLESISLELNNLLGKLI
jgi:hypothetical protein